MNKKIYVSLIFTFLFFILSCTERPRYSTHTYLVMGTLLNVTLPEDYNTYADSVFKIFALVDTLMNPLNPNSDVYRLNHNSGKGVKVHKWTADCIRKAVEIAELTHGAFDPTVGGIVHLWHFDEQGKYVFPDPDSLKKYIHLVDYRKIKIKGDTVWLGEGQSITLAGIAKGYAVDLAVFFLKEHGVRSGIIDAGGDLFLLGDKNGKSWNVGVRDPVTKGVREVISVKDKSVCTSGSYERFVEYKGKKYSHIFDPRTGYPVSNGVLSVTVIYNKATYADALATALFVLGPKRAMEIVENIKGLDAYIITEKEIFKSPGINRYVK